MRLHVITRCTRPENLRAVHKSFGENRVIWHVVFDTSAIGSIDAELLFWLHSVATNVKFLKGEQGSYMYPLMNMIVDLDIPKNRWVTLIDDDNIMHPDYYEALREVDADKYLAVCYHQQVDIARNSIRIAQQGNTIVGGIDLAQYTFKSNVIQEDIATFKAGYCGDGEFIQELHSKHPDKFLFIDKILSHYNYLQQVVPKKTSAPSVLYIGEGKPELKSFAHLGYEDTSLQVEHITNKDLVWNDYDFSKYDAIVSTEGEWKDVPVLPHESSIIRKRWVHTSEVDGELAYNVAMNSILNVHRPKVSYFTPAYKTPLERLSRLYNSIQLQTVDDWEWVIVNDSPSDKKLSDYLQLISRADSRVKVFTFNQPSGGCIGDVKYKAATLCSGELLAEVDHDDYLMPQCTIMLIQAMEAHPRCGFFYTNCREVDEQWNILKYPEGFAFGYGKYNDDGDSICVGINPKTIRHIVGVPNHIRAWRRETYWAVGGHNRRLTIADDYELIVRTFLKTKFCHIDACGYVQFIYNNESGQNTHNATRADIQRRVRTIALHYNHDIAERFHYLGVKDWAYEFNPANPLLAPSRFGKEENAVNVVFKPNP